MPLKYFIGVDISKLTLDVCLLHQGKGLNFIKIKNTVGAVKELLIRYKSEFGCKPSNTVICAEKMGVYQTFVAKACANLNFRISLETPLRIKRSLGIQRGKNDKLDSLRIANYLYNHHERCQFWQAPRPIINKLMTLNLVRKQMIKIKGMLSNSRKTLEHFSNQTTRKKINSFSKDTVCAVKEDIKNIQQKIHDLILSDKDLTDMFLLITSVPNIGNVMALEILLATNEFKNIDTPRKFASYCGIAPFEWSSGTSVKGKTKVSHYANKEMKALIHLAAMHCVKNRGGFLHDYYLRKVDEGKNKMSVLNAIRNKLIHRIFACVRGQKLYTEIQPEANCVN